MHYILNNCRLSYSVSKGTDFGSRSRHNGDMRFSERVSALVRLGFTFRDAKFLAIVLPHGGFFVRRQYCAYTRVNDQRGSWFLIKRLLAHRLAQPVRSALREDVYQLCGRPLHAAVDVPASDGRADPALVAREVMLLDFVLSEPVLEWYATSTEKSGLFARRLGVPEHVFPPYWPEDVPIFVAGQARLVHFVCLVVDPCASEIGMFVREHAALLRYLSGWTLDVVVPQGVTMDGNCEKAYARAIDSASLNSVADEDREWFARTQLLVDQENITNLTIADLRRYRELGLRIRRCDEARAPGPLVVHAPPFRY